MQYGLGRLFNIAKCVVPIDLSTGAKTGTRVHLKDYEGVAFVYVADIGTADEDVDLDIQQHNVATAGSPLDLDVVTQWWSKRDATALDNTEQWTKHTQAAASEVDLGATEGEAEIIAVVEVLADQLSDGYEWVSCNTTDSGTTTGKLGTVIAILFGPRTQRSPEKLPAPL